MIQTAWGDLCGCDSDCSGDLVAGNFLVTSCNWNGLGELSGSDLSGERELSGCDSESSPKPSE